jgi:hypothetical protein
MSGANERDTVRITDNNNDVTVSDNGGNSGVYETILDLEPPTDVEYEVENRHPGLRIILNLEDSGSSELSADASVRFIAQDATEEDTDQMGREYRYGEFSEANQRNEEEVVRFDLEEDYLFTEGSHFKMQLDHGTAVAWANSSAEIEVVRWS